MNSYPLAPGALAHWQAKRHSPGVYLVAPVGMPLAATNPESVVVYLRPTSATPVHGCAENGWECTRCHQPTACQHILAAQAWESR